jgi:putative transposase
VEAAVRKTYTYKLVPTPAQEQSLERVLWRCRTLYNVAMEERKTAWERCHVTVNYYQQKAELPDLKADCPEYAEVKRAGVAGGHPARGAGLPGLLPPREGG